jgi:predicted dithiol-disulfide oxidoreductase (DUF899 family)
MTQTYLQIVLNEAHGISVFHKNQEAVLFHTCSCYERGLDMLNGAYHYMFSKEVGF